MKRRSPSIESLGGDLNTGPKGTGVAGIACNVWSPRDFMTQPQVCARLRVTRITLWRMVKRGEFPASVEVGKRRAVWRGVDVNNWCKANAAHFERVIARRLPAALYR